MSIFVTGGAGFIGVNFVLDWVANNESESSFKRPAMGE